MTPEKGIAMCVNATGVETGIVLMLKNWPPSAITSKGQSDAHVALVAGGLVATFFLVGGLHLFFKNKYLLQIRGLVLGVILTSGFWLVMCCIYGFVAWIFAFPQETRNWQTAISVALALCAAVTSVFSIRRSALLQNAILWQVGSNTSAVRGQ
jgi:hypothetical protein